MENFRSMSCREGKMPYGSNGGIGGGSSKVHPPTTMQDLRSYSTNTSSYAHHNTANPHMSSKYEKTSNHGSNGPSKSWSFTDPEIQRKKRVASYKVYAVEGKMKGSFKKSFRWIKSTCSYVVHGWW